MLDSVIDAAQRNDRAMREGRSLRQAFQARGDPGRMLVRELARLLEAAARRHREHDFAAGGVDTQGVAARLPMTAHAHHEDVVLEKDLDRRRFGGRAGLEQSA